MMNDASSLYQAIKKGEDASFIIQGFKRVYPELNLHEEDGKFVARIKLVRDGRTYVYAALPVMDVTDTGDSITMYGEKGESMKLLVFDTIQPNYNNACIFGRELSAQFFKNVAHDFKMRRAH
jgi:hypothetical protein